MSFSFNFKSFHLRNCRLSFKKCSALILRVFKCRFGNQLFLIMGLALAFSVRAHFGRVNVGDLNCNLKRMTHFQIQTSLRLFFHSFRITHAWLDVTFSCRAVGFLQNSWSSFFLKWVFHPTQSFGQRISTSWIGSKNSFI
jgi:hypothetical protein